MRQSSIYNVLDIPSRASDCSFGASGGFSQEIRVGTSRQNSHRLAYLQVTEDYDALLDIRTFVLTFDGFILKRLVLHGKQSKLESAQFNNGKTP